MLSEFGAALMLLTRLPIPALPTAVDPARAVWAYPVVGALIGGLAGIAYWLLTSVGLPAPLASIWTVAALLLLTGGLHEDGLADTADGFGGGRTVARKLEIMRDSRIGSYGALALLLSTGVRGVAITLLASPDRVGAALVAAGALSRGAIAVPLLVLHPARSDGLGAALRERRPGRAVLALVLATVIAVVVAPSNAAVGVPLALVAALGLTTFARAQIGGYTGDVLGACALLAECAALSGFSR